ncbi:hypothetical protein AYO44_06670 [Planctomycetaceae bacterium SCGC AG-212-F19]|nr:hypothetical protein AYO44_06670 [Planctomycetaceae bacterium SCGC AG-212-F19]
MGTNATVSSPEPLFAAAPDQTGYLNVTGPTIRQELFLRRQKLWSPDLTQGEAGWLIGERLKELAARKKAVYLAQAAP